MSISNAVDAAPIPDAGQALALDEFHCPTCGYSLRGLISDRCPECGESLTPLRSVESAIPWVNRARIGWVRGFFETIWFATFQQKRFAMEIVRPASPRRAAEFRWVVLALIVFAEIALAGFLYPVGPNDYREAMRGPGVTLIAGAICAILLPLAIIAKSRHAFLEAKELDQQLRARVAVLSDYLCGGLLLFPVAQIVILSVFIGGGAPEDPDDLLGGFLAASAIILAAITALHWFVITRLASKWMQSRTGTIVFGVLLAGSWILTILLLVGVSAAGLYAWVALQCWKQTSG